MLSEEPLSSASSILRRKAFLRRVLSRTGRCALFAASLAFLGGGAARAADGTWIATGSGLYLTSANWSGGAVPTGVATFSNLGGGTVTVNGGIPALSGMTFDSNASAYTLDRSGGFYLEFAAGGVLQTVGTGSQSQTFTAPVVFGATGAFTSGYTTASDVLIFKGPVYSRTNATNTLTLNGSNMGANTISGAVGNGDGHGTTALVKSGSGNWMLSGTNTYTGTTQVNGGLLMVTGTHNGGGAYTVAGGTLGGAGGRISASGITLTSAAGSGINVSGAGLGTTGSQNALTAPGTLQLASSLDISHAGLDSLTFVLTTPEASDRVELISGSLNIGSGVLDLSTFHFDISNWEETGAEGTYILFATPSPSGITGTLAATGLTGILGGYNVSLTTGTYGAGLMDIQLNVAPVPEPSTVSAVLIGLLLCLAAGFRRRRTA